MVTINTTKQIEHICHAFEIGSIQNVHITREKYHYLYRKKEKRLIMKN